MNILTGEDHDLLCAIRYANSQAPDPQDARNRIDAYRSGFLQGLLHAASIQLLRARFPHLYAAAINPDTSDDEWDTAVAEHTERTF